MPKKSLSVFRPRNSPINLRLPKENLLLFSENPLKENRKYETVSPGNYRLLFQNKQRAAVSYFLYSGVIQTGQDFTISGDEAGHILKSRRIQIGEAIHIQDQETLRYEVRVEKLANRSLTVFPLQKLKTPSESPLRIHLYQALVKEKALDTIIQKCTELGVCSICFFHSRYSQRIPAKAGLEKKKQRWLRIAVEACKQSGRVAPPAISFISDLSEFHQVSVESSIETIPSFCLESSGETVSINNILADKQELNLVVGPEGGWGPGDLKSQAFQSVHLGPRILRSETAAIAAIAILQSLSGDLGHAPISNPGNQQDFIID